MIITVPIIIFRAIFFYFLNYILENYYLFGGSLPKRYCESRLVLFSIFKASIKRHNDGYFPLKSSITVASTFNEIIVVTLICS